ncbi:2-C-methyl-D-erythritol 2,4-cyclodiphosphate synthase [Mycoplasma bradburyae]|uniref:2-C-methyl-D-erythritol 2,4-cyclodiphosphate synthase n=1 Tax=Mycoplasma bradburyae TaxID=2963128 RepID=A0AAW6HS77_9MOLU|nr:2-C-methyl-D-erythritol 2,4-cyclodiphosphate synthase [Mycoplasma bradburyae]MDC4163244.1 2-C-methyl-D-erythritol 2,4-cyclodiphosphate synthase [Mycoplasma bradburyae]MDC4181858.1 2-C-methyl-D-erythritol 2,4-cyclodiphosphate synthase [Mycoplasma bradburyae]MDC4182557.1 2-C-methyl-D-erythritol 2,4-cyclodiphosphate synthase [Mycoplasma bradburyae]MDC4183235.1 2-C-methyl-D-erythritol 2,4-cyclodiphosphate synthase [Mycoplasma bradburyae]MDC4184041.1 2-C-methyl-D-erythritol 2,4-cyclodiphosphate 
MEIRIGQGFDSHKLKNKKNNQIFLGGIPIKADQQVIANSDGDVVIHALSDAVLGCGAFGDIGMYFNENDPTNKGLDSKTILNYCLKLIKKLKLDFVNIDLTIFAQDIRIDPVRLEIKSSLMKLTGCKQVNVKAKSYEEPRNEIACSCVVLMSSNK